MKLSILNEELHEFSSTQVQLPESIAGKIVEFGHNINKAHIAQDGLEDDIHITVKYGIHTNDYKKVKEVVDGFGPVRAILKNIDYFPANESRDSDVVKISVESEDLQRLNKLIRDYVECTDTYPTYNPHITIGYVIPGAGKKYKSDAFNGIEVEFTELVFSDRNRIKRQIDLI